MTTIALPSLRHSIDAAEAESMRRELMDKRAREATELWERLRAACSHFKTWLWLAGVVMLFVWFWMTPGGRASVMVVGLIAWISILAIESSLPTSRDFSLAEFNARFSSPHSQSNLALVKRLVGELRENQWDVDVRFTYYDPNRGYYGLGVDLALMWTEQPAEKSGDPPRRVPLCFINMDHGGVYFP